MPRTLSRRTVLCGSCGIAAFAVLGRMPVTAQEPTATPDPTVTALERDKLAWEVAKLKEEATQLRDQNEDPLAQWLGSDWLRNNAVVVSGAVVALIGVFQWFAQRRQERDKRDEDRLAAVFDGLGSPNEVSRINAAHNLHAFLEPGYKRFHTRILHLVVDHLRHQSKPADDQLPLVTQGLIIVSRRQPDPKGAELPLFPQSLVSVFKDAYPSSRPKRGVGRWVAGRVKREADRPSPRAGSPLDMTGVQLPGAYLVNTDLSDVFMPHANLTDAKFHGATRTRANLQRADLTGANLRYATHIRVDLWGATLTGVDLTGATLTGTFVGVVIGLTPEQRRMAVEQGAILGELYENT